MKRSCIYLLFLLVFVSGGCSASRDAAEISWPEVSRENKPWTYWWWHGSAVDRRNITANLETFSEAGIGGVHIIPIYGFRGGENLAIPYLSHEWMAMLEHTSAEASRLGMGVDMTTGTGWPFGGPNIGADDASSFVRIESFETRGGTRFRRNIAAGTLQEAAAFSDTGEYILIPSAGDNPNAVEADLPPGPWTVLAVVMDGTGQQVKRAAPGGEGNVLDYLSESSLARYLKQFDKAFEDRRSGLVRAFYNDSYEVYGANWTDDLLDEFRLRRGYDLMRHLPSLNDTTDSDTASRVRHDYNETVAELLLQRFTQTWAAWCAGKGSLTRNQAHGSPGNLLDLYAAADIPETEAFGPSGFPIPGLRVDTSIPEHFGKPDYFVEKFASSAAHVTGKQLVSSESCTWLGEHFQVSLSQVKPEIDALFTAGINHVFFHGIAYSPDNAPWPGRLFYASTNFGPTGSIWNDMPCLTAYIARCQSFLQDGEPNGDILLYWPVHDIWRKRADDDMLHHFQVHNAHQWLQGTPFHDAATSMLEHGYSFDYISDAQLADAAVETGDIVTSGGRYRVLVVPGCRYMPADTMENITGLVGAGAAVIFTGCLPDDVPGMSHLESERLRFKTAVNLLGTFDAITDDVRCSHAGDGRVFLGDDISGMLADVGIRREELADEGLRFDRRRFGDGYVYFVANLGSQAVGQWITLAVEAKSAALFDPATGAHGVIPVRKGSRGDASVYLSIDPGQSLLIRTFDHIRVRGAKWLYSVPAGDYVDVKGEWHVAFIDGGPKLPKDYSTSRLESWTRSGSADALSFHGTARYEIRIARPDVVADDWMLELGCVRESARVRVNGLDIGAVWSSPFRVRLDGALIRETNNIEIDVVNLAANRISDLDRRGVDWKIFNDINFVTIAYQPFDASSWTPMDSGLLGPVRLMPLSLVKRPD